MDEVRQCGHFWTPSFAIFVLAQRRFDDSSNSPGTKRIADRPDACDSSINIVGQPQHIGVLAFWPVESA